MIKNARIGHEVHVKAKLNELYDFDVFTKIQRQIIDELGCTACTSGINMRFDIEKFFGKYDNPERNTMLRSDKAQLTDVIVVAPAEVANNFDTNVAARRAVLKELGCEPCTSGFNILFQSELIYAVNREAEVVQLG